MKKKKMIFILISLIVLSLLSFFLIKNIIKEDNEETKVIEEITPTSTVTPTATPTPEPSEEDNIEVSETDNEETTGEFLSANIDEYPTMTYVYCSELLEEQESIEEEQIIELPYYLDEYYEEKIEDKIIENPEYPTDYNFKYMSGSYAVAPSEIGYYIRLWFENNKDYYLDAVYSYKYGYWAFEIHEMQYLPAEHNDYNYGIPIYYGAETEEEKQQAIKDYYSIVPELVYEENGDLLQNVPSGAYTESSEEKDASGITVTENN